MGCANTWISPYNQSGFLSFRKAHEVSELNPFPTAGARKKRFFGDENTSITQPTQQNTLITFDTIIPRTSYH